MFLPSKAVQRPVGICLSGGGARGFAHLGVLQALMELKIPIDYLSGVSAGAIAAVFFAAGYTPTEILDFFIHHKITRFFRLTVPHLGFMKNTMLYKLLKEKLPENLQDLKIPTFVAVTELNSGECFYMNKGHLARLVLASSTIPILFKPVLINNKLYVDGGVMNNLPIEPLLPVCNTIIASHVNPFIYEDNVNSIMKMLERILQLSMRDKIEEKKNHCHYFIEPPSLGNYKLFDMKKGYEMMMIGYNYTIRIINA